MQFIRVLEYIAASPHSWRGNPDLISCVMVLEIGVRLNLSGTELPWGCSAGPRLIWIAESWRTFKKFVDEYSPPWSIFNFTINFPIHFSIIIPYCLNFSSASDFCFSRYMTLNLEWSSMNLRMYRAPEGVGGCMRPSISVWMRLRMSEARWKEEVAGDCLIFPIAQGSQGEKSVQDKFIL